MEQFHAFQVSPGKEHALEVPPQHGFHHSIVSFPHETKNGRTTLYVSVEGKSYAVATLDTGKNILQVPLDLVFNGVQKTVFYAKGSCAVHCVGYVRELDIEGDDGLPPFGYDDDEEESEVEQVAPSNKKAIKGDATKLLKGSDKRGKKPHSESEDEENVEEGDALDSDDSDEELEADDSEQDPTQAPPSSSDDTDEDGDHDSSDEEDGDEEFDEEISSNPPDASSDDDDDDSEIEDEAPPAKLLRQEHSPVRPQHQTAKGGANAQRQPKGSPKQPQTQVANRGSRRNRS